jgi:hypothetical protein
MTQQCFPNNKQPTKKKSKSNAIVNTVAKLAGTVGSLVTAWKSAAKGNKASSMLGKAGGILFGDRGNQFGQALGHTFTGITGMGDYKLTAGVPRALLAPGKTAPKMKRTGDDFVIEHREFLYNVSGSTAFNKRVININPGLAELLPWGSRIAQYFEEYTFDGLVFEYRPSSGMVTSVSPALGIVGGSTDYNVASATPSTKQQAESTIGVVSCPPFQSFLHPIECKDNMTRKLLVRSGEVSDRRWYDIARTTIFTDGMPSTYVCGELWVSYRLRLSKPRIAPCVPGDFCSITANITTSTANRLSYQGTTKVCSMDVSADLLTLGFPFPGIFQVMVTTLPVSGSWTAANYTIDYQGYCTMRAPGEYMYSPEACELQTQASVIGRNGEDDPYTTTAGRFLIFTVWVTAEEEAPGSNSILISGWDTLASTNVTAVATCMSPQWGLPNTDLV